MWSAKLRNPRTGRTIEAIIKPNKPNSKGTWNDVARDFAAYYVNLNVLGMDYVPPTAYRKRFQLKNKGSQKSTYIPEASVTLKIPSAEELVEVPPENWGLSPDALKSDHRILRYLLGDPDGHEDNVIFGSHWNSKNGEKTPMFIDFGASFISQDQLDKSKELIKEPISMRYYSEHAGIFRGEVTKIRRKTYERLVWLKKLKEDGKLESLLGSIGGGNLFLAKYDKALIEQRIDDVLSYFNSINLNDKAKVIIEE